MHIKSSKSRKKIALMVLAALSIVGLFLAGFYMYYNQPTIYDKIDYSPATSKDKKYNDTIKDGLLNSSNSEQSPSDEGSPTKQVTPVITAWGQPEGPGKDFKLNGYAPTVVESEGKCTLVLTRESTIVTAEKIALQNAQDTSCGQMTIPFEKLTIGVWKAVLSYSSPSATGSSAAIEVNIK